MHSLKYVDMLFKVKSILKIQQRKIKQRKKDREEGRWKAEYYSMSVFWIDSKGSSPQSLERNYQYWSTFAYKWTMVNCQWEQMTWRQRNMEWQSTEGEIKKTDIKLLSVVQGQKRETGNKRVLNANINTQLCFSETFHV